MKSKIFSVCFSVRKRRLSNQNRIILTKRLIRARNSSRSADVVDLENQLSSLITKEAEGAKIRSRAQWFEEGEKPTRYFSVCKKPARLQIIFLLFLMKTVLRKILPPILEKF